MGARLLYVTIRVYHMAESMSPCAYDVWREILIMISETVSGSMVPERLFGMLATQKAATCTGITSTHIMGGKAAGS